MRLDLMLVRARKAAWCLKNLDIDALRGATAVPSLEHQSLRDLDIQHVIDVGAHGGQFSRLATILWPDAAIDAFEPNPTEAARYRRTLNTNSKTVRLHNCALGSEADSKTLFLTSASDSSSLLRPAISGNASHRVVGGTEVEVARLDAVLGFEDILRPSLLKLDVQGFEQEVLRGSGELLHAVDYVYVEVSFQPAYQGQPTAGEVVAYLHQKHYALHSVHDLARDSAGRPDQGDLLFERHTFDGTSVAHEERPPAPARTPTIGPMP